MDEKLNVKLVIDRAAYNVLSKFRQYVEHADLVSVGQLWCLDHPEKMAEFESDEQPRLAAWRLDKAVWKAQERYARKERAHRLGFSAKDEFFYSEDTIESLLPRVMGGDPVPDRKEPDEVRAKGDPAEGGEYLASYLDVQRAWEKAPLATQEQAVLYYTYADGASQEAIGELLGVTRQTVSRAHSRGVRKLQKFLGGAPVGDCPYTCECHEGKLRQRPGARRSQHLT